MAFSTRLFLLGFVFVALSGVGLTQQPVYEACFQYIDEDWPGCELPQGGDCFNVQSNCGGVLFGQTSMSQGDFQRFDHEHCTMTTAPVKCKIEWWGDHVCLRWNNYELPNCTGKVLCVGTVELDNCYNR